MYTYILCLRYLLDDVAKEGYGRKFEFEVIFILKFKKSSNTPESANFTPP